MLGIQMRNSSVSDVKVIFSYSVEDTLGIHLYGFPK